MYRINKHIKLSEREEVVSPCMVVNGDRGFLEALVVRLNELSEAGVYYGLVAMEVDDCGQIEG